MSDPDPELAHVTSDLVVLTVTEGALHVALTHREDPEGDGAWSLPRAFVRAGESADDAAVRALHDEVGASAQGVTLEQLKTYTDPPANHVPTRIISIAWLALGAGPSEVRPGPEAGTDSHETQWVRVEEALAGSLDVGHAEMLTDGIHRAGSKLEYTSLATSFLGEEFTVSELRGVYEAVWGGCLEPANFHRKALSVDGFLEATGNSRIGRGRPAKLYRRGGASVIHPPLTRAAIRGER